MEQQKHSEDLASTLSGSIPDTKRYTKRNVIREGDTFKSKSGCVYRVFDCLGFGRGYWVSDQADRSQTIFKRDELLRMERV